MIGAIYMAVGPLFRHFVILSQKNIFSEKESQKKSQNILFPLPDISEYTGQFDLFSQKKVIGAIHMAVGPLFRHFCDFEPQGRPIYGKSSLRGPPGRLHHPKGLPTLRPGGRALARSPGRLHHPQGLINQAGGRA